MKFRAQRIRDPLHNIIAFRAKEFEDAIWRAMQTRPFQRLRRIKQLGFSEMVYPGASHTRFSHSVGVFHTARQLMSVIEEHLGEQGFKPSKAQQALAAALVHDLGHGPFSHAFEEVGMRLGLRLASHERMSELLIRSEEVREAFRPLGGGFVDDVADIIGAEGPGNIYSAVVSSQFDADRLDYMRRDRLMTGTHHGAIDFDWLLSNLEVGEVSAGVDETKLPNVETFVLGPKAVYAAETYLLGLFQLYPTVYFHKATRCAEKLFTELLIGVLECVRNGQLENTGLSRQHPIVRFGIDSDNVENFLALDDTVIWGALPMLREAKDPLISEFANRLLSRRLFKCVDVRRELLRQAGLQRVDDDSLDRACAAVTQKIREWLMDKANGSPRILMDQASRTPYKRLQEDKGPLNQIMIRENTGGLVDVAKTSKVINAVETFSLFRVYAAAKDEDAFGCIDSVIRSEVPNVTRR